jgi:hypothetical protein
MIRGQVLDQSTNQPIINRMNNYVVVLDWGIMGLPYLMVFNAIWGRIGME